MTSRRRPGSLLGLTACGLISVVSLVGMIWTPFDPYDINLDGRLLPASTTHWLGTDEFGRDVLSRLMRASGISLGIAALSTVLALCLGAFLGGAAAFFRGWIERGVLLACDALMAFPALLLALGIMAVAGPNEIGVIFALAIAFTPRLMRITRAAAISISERDYVKASRVLGNGEWYTMLRHVLPNCISPLTVAAGTIFGTALLAETALSFLGIGMPPPTATWGGMMADGRQYIDIRPGLIVIPGSAISVAMLGINLLADALRDRLDPRMRHL
ncbi:MAG: ABC transporter permease [Gammaproteobacteria bacterium]|nr:ABC transporter permease [Gammaproteobacteria bacterium]